MKTLIIGTGEIGRSLCKVLVKYHEVWMRDKNDEPYGVNLPKISSEALGSSSIIIKSGEIKVVSKQGNNPEHLDVLNICYPPSKDFVNITKAYIRQYNPKVTIIHSTVAPGTTMKCGKMVVHSPVHGKHPDISSGLTNYTKYLGGENAYAVDIARDFLKRSGIPVKVVASSKTSELSKILCTTYYGWNIVFMKEVVKLCEQHGVPFSEVYMDWNFLYNKGNTDVGSPQFNRPVLKPVGGKIGGHCVVENCHLLSSDITDFIIKKNDEYKRT